MEARGKIVLTCEKGYADLQCDDSGFEALTRVVIECIIRLSRTIDNNRVA